MECLRRHGVDALSRRGQAAPHTWLLRSSATVGAVPRRVQTLPRGDALCGRGATRALLGGQLFLNFL